MLFFQNRNLIFSVGYQIIEDNKGGKLVHLILSIQFENFMEK